MSEQWQRLSAELDALFELEAPERESRLAQIASAEPELAAKLRRLLAADAEAGVLDDGVARVAPTVLSRLAAGMPVDGSSADDGGPGAASGRLVGPYRLLQRIGSGGMGDVWLGERAADDFEQQVAIKLIRPLLDSPALRERFSRERRILARLDHPNIARLLDGGVTEDGLPWYAMEYVRGTDILRFADEAGLDVRARVELLLPVCDAVAHAQSQLVIHRDLKPSNVLVDAEGRPRVLDFGIARLLDDSLDNKLTTTGLRVFSPAYAAPEQIRGAAVGTAVDVYALGAMLFELLTGRVPHPRRAAAPELLLAQLDGEDPPRPSDVWRTQQTAPPDTAARRHARELGGDLDTVVRTALQPDAARRYSGAAQLAEDLRRWLAGRPVAAQRDTAGYRMRKFAARHRLAVGSASAVLLALIGGIAAALWQADVARRHAARADAEAARATEQAEVAEAVSAFLTRDVIQAANPFRSEVDISLGDALLQAGERIDPRFQSRPRLAGVLHRELAESVYLAGVRDGALKHAERASDILLTAFGSADPDALQARLLQARLLHAAEEFTTAGRLLKAGIESLPPDAPAATRLAFEVGLAGVDVDERREPQAIEQLTRLLPRIIGTAGYGSQLHIDALNHRMRGYAQTDRFADALADTRNLRAVSEQTFGADDARTLPWAQREITALTDLERYDEALALATLTCPAMERAIGRSHPIALECRRYQGIVLFELRRFDEALALIEPVAAARSIDPGAEAPSTWVTWVWLARCRQRLGQLDEAESVFLRIRDAANNTLGQSDPNALPFTQTYGMFLEQTGRHREAEVLRRELLDRAKRLLPPGHVGVAKYAWDVGETFSSLRDDTELLPFYAEWLPQWEVLFGDKDSRVVDARLWLQAAQQRVAVRAESG